MTGWESVEAHNQGECGTYCQICAELDAHAETAECECCGRVRNVDDLIIRTDDNHGGPYVYCAVQWAGDCAP